MSLFTTITQRLTTFFLKPELPSTIGIFRILFSTLTFGVGLLLWPDLPTWYGALSPVPARVASGFLAGGSHFTLFTWLPQTDAFLYGFYGVWMVSIFLMGLGFWTRVSSTLVYLGIISLHHRNPLILHSGDTLLRIISFLMIFSEAGKAYSLDRWLDQRRRGIRLALQPSAPWAHRLIQIQVAIVYLSTSLYKLRWGPSWRDGSALYYILQIDHFKRFPIPHFMTQYWVTRLMTWSAVGIELLLGTLIWFPRLRIPIVFAGISLHLCIEYCMNIQFFELLMVACLIGFLPPTFWAIENFRRLGKYLEFRVSIRRSRTELDRVG